MAADDFGSRVAQLLETGLRLERDKLLARNLR